MKNPFPGIDPFVESFNRWRDFHVTFMVAWRDAVSQQLPENYVACLEEQVSVVEYEEERMNKRSPDIAVVKSKASVPEGKQAVATLEVPRLEPEITRVVIEEEVRHAYMEILYLPKQELVAVLELLSPTNKSGDGRAQYLAKRQQILLSEAHLVELDLLLTGKQLPLEKPQQAHFHAVVARAGQRPECELYAWNLDRQLPSIPIPLRHPDSDILVNLAEVLATTYQRGRYDKIIDYHQPLTLPLTEDYQAWVRERIEVAASTPK